ncbi:P22 phage major capsid protein family protein [Herbaspirillum sp. ST 5-3]|uniref:P22 phage major capsid protein family protein n=1 Tax=Oxalobacteraceae TaxID=75682 RepID=UPI0010A4D879|nr:P22 phage major capsid protein family protein [Herbaspirillum sp. ST 5-3]
MASSYQVADMITKEGLLILHEKIPFISTINCQYDDQYAKKGGKIGSDLRIRLPNQYTVRTGKTAQVQDSAESSVTMTMATQKGVDLGMSSVDLTLSIDEIKKRHLEPAMSALAADIESTVISGVTPEVYNLVGTAGTTPATMLTFGQARQKLNEYLAPKDNRRRVQVDSATMSTMTDAYKGLFQSGKAIDKQYIEGYIDRQGGFDWYENESIYSHTNGSDVTGVTVNDTVASGDSSMTIANCSSAPTVGSVFTVAGVYAVHPETKRAYGHLQQFVVTGTPTATDISFSPAMISTGGKQNVSALPDNGAALVWVGAASTSYGQCLAYHEDAFAFVSADLEVPGGVDMAAINRFEGLSMRFIRQYDAVNDDWISRIDVLFGYKAIRPQLACRITK